jgi:hypothetical protein
MASGKVSKNSRTSKPSVVIKEKRVKPKKETILVEVIGDMYKQIKENGLVEYEGKTILDIVRRYGKNYLILENK